MKTVRLLVPMSLLLLFPVVLTAQRPLGDPFLVNVHTVGSQVASGMAAIPSGEFVVIWASERNGWDTALYARRFAADGRPATGEILISPDHQAYLQSGVVMMADGSFAVVFSKQAPRGSGSVLRTRWYTPDGTLQDDVLIARETVPQLSIATRGDGGVVLAWLGDRSPFLRARAFGPDHAPLGPEVKVARLGGSPAVAVGSTGQFVVAFTGFIEGNPVDRDDDRLYVGIQRFAADGSPLGRPFAASPVYDLSPFNIHVGNDAAGNFLVSWTGQFGPLLGVGTFIHRYGADGNPLGRVVRLPMFATALTVGLRGNFVLGWTEFGLSGPTDTEAFAQRFAADGSPLGPAVRVSPDTPGNHYLSSVAIGANGGFVATWDSSERDPDSFHYDVFARRYRRR